MRIEVAVDAMLELETGVDRHAVGAGLVAFLAGRCGVLSGEGETRLGMIERLLFDLCALPRSGVVALQAILAKPALVLVLVASGAGGAQAHPGVIQILLGEERTRCRSNVRRSMTLAALRGRVLSIKDVPGLGVIEALRRRIPMQHVEVFAVVIGMALDACSSGRACLRIGGVQATVRLQFVADLAVAFDAAETCRAGGDRVALRAVGRAVEAFVCLRQRARRNLGMSDRRKETCRDGKTRQSEGVKQELSSR